MSTLHTSPRGSGAYATQPSCDLHTSAAAWLWLTPAELRHSQQRGPAQVTRVSRIWPIFSHTSFCHIMEDPSQLHFPWRKLHFRTHVNTAVLATLTRRGMELNRLFLCHSHSFLLVLFFFSALFLFTFCFRHSQLQCWSPSTNPQKLNSATKNPLCFKSLLNISFLQPSQTHSSLPLFHSFYCSSSSILV